MKPQQLKIGRNRRQAHQVPQVARKPRPPTVSTIPANIKAPGFGVDRGDSWVKPGRYLMRNGSAAIVAVPVTLKFGVQMRQTWQGWQGQIEGQVGEMLVWGLDGKRGAAPQHEHDLVKRHKNQKITACVGCGCVDARACKGGCFWVSPGWCSACDVNLMGKK
jgi:hypothetical protein